MSEITLRDGVNEITFVGERPYPLPPEGVWEFSDLVDWTGQTEDKVPLRERPQAHGAFDVDKSLRSSRALSFNARFVGHTEAQTEAACEVLDAIGAAAPAEIVVATATAATSRVVSVEKVTPLNTRGVTIASRAVDLIARDSRRYSVDVESRITGPAQAGQGRVWPAVWPLVWPAGGSSGRITLTNTGKAPSAPTFILEGGFDTALITCLETGARIGFNRQVPVGSSVVIDTAERRAMIDGQSDVSRWLRYREWELIPPGASRTFQFDVTGAVLGEWSETRRNLFTSAVLTSGLGIAQGTNQVASVPGAVGFTLPVAAGDIYSIRRTLPLSNRFRYTFTSVLPAAGVSSLGGDGTGGLDATEVLNGIVTPAGSTYLFLYLSSSATTLSPLLIERAATAGAYFDGSTPPVGSSLRYRYLAGAGSSPSVEETRSFTASLEGQVRSAWW